MTPTVSFDAAGSPRFGFEAGAGVPDVEVVLTDVFALLAEAAEQRPAALVLDEFQAITRHGPSFPDLLKALADEHPAVSLVLAGSRRHLMEELVVHTQAPLYGMAQRLALGPIPDDAIIDYLCRRAGEAGKTLDPDTAAYLVRIGGPVPNDIQHLAFEAFEVAATRVDREPPSTTACAWPSSTRRLSSPRTCSASPPGRAGCCGAGHRPARGTLWCRLRPNRRPGQCQFGPQSHPAPRGHGGRRRPRRPAGHSRPLLRRLAAGSARRPR